MASYSCSRGVMDLTRPSALAPGVFREKWPSTGLANAIPAASASLAPRPPPQFPCFSLLRATQTPARRERPFTRSPCASKNSPAACAKEPGVPALRPMAACDGVTFVGAADGVGVVSATISFASGVLWSSARRSNRPVPLFLGVDCCAERSDRTMPLLAGVECCASFAETRCSGLQLGVLLLALARHGEATLSTLLQGALAP